MRNMNVLICCFAVVMQLSFSVAQEPCGNGQSALNNDSILSLVKAGVSADVIVAKIQQTANHFDTSPTALASLKAAGISDQILRAMVIAPSVPPFSGSQQPTETVARVHQKNTVPPRNMAGAVQIYGDGGWSFGLPAVMAVASFGPFVASSPEKKTLAAPNFGVSVTAWKYLTPFVDVGFYDTGKAIATVGPVTSELSGTTFSVNGGLRLVRSGRRIQEYVQFGGGVLRQNLKGRFTLAGVSNTFTNNGSLGELLYGGGVQLFAGKHWGSDLGFDGFRLVQSTALGGQNFSRVRIGIFYQTKSSPK